MCHDHDSRPPAPPRTGDVRERGVLTLTAADGNEFSAAFAAPAEVPRVGVVILPDVRGLHPYYVALAERFAETGAAAVEPRLDGEALERMIAQADKQHDWLADVRREVAAEVFGGHAGPADAAADS